MDAFKIGLSLFIAAVAGLIIMVSGLGSGARFSTVFLRMMVGFVFVGAFVWVLAYLFRQYFFRRLIRVGLMEARLAKEAAEQENREDEERDSIPTDETVPVEETHLTAEEGDVSFSPLEQEVPRLQVVEESKKQG